MTDQLNRPRAQSHFVPCVLRTIEILDALRHSRLGMRIEDMRSSSRASRSTTYRIVRSLLHGGYIARDSWGRYHLNPAIIQYAPYDGAPHLPAPRTAPSPDIQHLGRWGHFTPQDGRSTAVEA